MNERGTDDDMKAAEEDDSCEQDVSKEDDATYNVADMKWAILRSGGNSAWC